MTTGGGAAEVAHCAQLSVIDDVTTAGATGEESALVLPADLAIVDESFVALYVTHYPRLVRALQYSGADHATAEDVAQEAFARTLGHWARIQNGTNPAGYAYRVAFRLGRRAGSREPRFERVGSAGDVGTEATLHAGIDAALSKMPPAQRRCAVLCLVVGLSTADVARTLHIAQSTVRKQVERARSDLREALRDD